MMIKRVNMNGEVRDKGCKQVEFRLELDVFDSWPVYKTQFWSQNRFRLETCLGVPVPIMVSDFRFQFQVRISSKITS